MWLIFVLTVTWTAYPSAFGAIASTLAVPLLLAGIGVIFRGAAYALRAGTERPRELGLIDSVFSLASFLTPFALGTMVGAVASGRVPVGNAAGSLFGSWLNPTSLLVGVLAVVLAAYMAAVYLAADGARSRRARPRRALSHPGADRRACSRGRSRWGACRSCTPMRTGCSSVCSPARGSSVCCSSAAGGIGTMALVARRRYDAARVSAALAVAGLIIGWALAQQPLLLAHLTLAQAAAPRTHDHRLARRHRHGRGDPLPLTGVAVRPRPARAL